MLAALEDPGYASVRAYLADILVSLSMRVEDVRLSAALRHHLLSDPDAAVRARIARMLGLRVRHDSADALLQATADADPEVRHQALLALGGMESRLSDDLRQQLNDRLGDFLRDPSPGVRAEAMIRASHVVAARLQEAERAVLEGRVADAERIYERTVAEFPSSQRARYRRGRHAFDSGDVAGGIDLLRRGRVLLDIPPLPAAPRIDGRLDDAVWNQAARADSFWQLSFHHEAALPTRTVTVMWLGYTRQALYMAFHCRDDHPDSLVARYTAEVDAARRPGFDPRPGMTIFRDDIVELFIDPGFDRSDYSHLGINSLGVVVDDWIRFSRREAAARGVSHGAEALDQSWAARDEVGVHVGVDHWNVEYRLGFDEHHPRPRAGDIWGFNAVRVFRGQEYSQWIRTYEGGHSPEQFGLLLFR